jgi:leucyl aminopeptidase
MSFLTKKTARTLPVTPVSADGLDVFIRKQDARTAAWIRTSGYTATAGNLLLIPDADGSLSRVLFGVGRDDSLYTYAALPALLPKNDAGYFIDRKFSKERATDVAIGWTMGCYQFSQYKTGRKKDFAHLVWPDGADRKFVTAVAEAITLVRDMVNAPANDMGPEEIAAATQKLAKSFPKTSFSTIVGDDLLKKNYPAVHAVGKGSPRAPRIAEFTWGSNPKHPLVTLVGKGVAFDTGGLDIKPASAMALMKKDMGGAAHVLGLAHIIMSQNLPVRLRVIIAAVENATDGNAFRPGDILKTRKGITVEVGDTDAEGRLILADGLAESCRDNPDLIIDFATLTGAARVALGPDLPAMFCNDDKIADALAASSRKTQDPLWRLPLWTPYRDMLASKVADTNNIGGSFAGAITAALFLEKFVDPSCRWVHIDTFAWNAGARPGRPDGGEALGIRACYDLIKTTIAKKK